MVGADWLGGDASCVCFFWGGLVGLRVVDGGVREGGGGGGGGCAVVHVDFPAAVSIFVCLSTPQTSLNISLQHIFPEPQTPKAICRRFQRPPQKTDLKTFLSRRALSNQMCSQQSKRSLSAGTLAKPCQSTEH